MAYLAVEGAEIYTDDRHGGILGRGRDGQGQRTMQPPHFNFNLRFDQVIIDESRAFHALPLFSSPLSHFVLLSIYLIYSKITRILDKSPHKCKDV